MNKPITIPPNWEDTPKSFERFKQLAKDLMSQPKEEPGKGKPPNKRSDTKRKKNR